MNIDPSLVMIFKFFPFKNHYSLGIFILQFSLKCNKKFVIKIFFASLRTCCISFTIFKKDFWRENEDKMFDVSVSRWYVLALSSALLYFEQYIPQQPLLQCDIKTDVVCTVRSAAMSAILIVRSLMTCTKCSNSICPISNKTVGMFEIEARSHHCSIYVKKNYIWNVCVEPKHIFLIQ